MTIENQPGLPTYSTIDTIHTLLKANAASVPSQLRGGKHGILGLLLHPETYKKLTTHDFTAPNNPGTSSNIPDGATGPQINEIVRDHKTKLREWQETTRTDQALQQQLITALDEQYLRGLRNKENIIKQYPYSFLFQTIESSCPPSLSKP